MNELEPLEREIAKTERQIEKLAAAEAKAAELRTPSLAVSQRERDLRRQLGV